MVAGIALFCVALLLVRFVVFPRVEAYRDDLTAALSAQLRQPVEIDAALDRLGRLESQARDPRLPGAQQPPARTPLLDLPEVDLIVAWTSLPALDLRLKQLSSCSRGSRSGATARACCASPAWSSTPAR